MPRASKLLPSIGHAASGAGGTIVSTLATYPLDLVNTRLKVQRQLRADGSIGPEDAYKGIADAFRTIYSKEGGLSAFFAGLGPDLLKSAADSFLFFLFYTWFRARRLRARNDAPYLSALEELAVGAVAGACAKAFTTPASNVVTRQQTGSSNGRSFGEIVADIRREKGLLGLWAGYSASLVLTLNPSTTFFLQQMLKRALVPREDWDAPGAQITFILAAVSKSVATTLTYPFQIAKARVQISSSSVEERKKNKGSIVGDTIFAMVFRIAKTEGVRALYDGIGGELLKAFFNHGTTMLSKDIIHGLIVRLYFAIIAALKTYPRLKSRLRERRRGVTRSLQRGYLQASSSIIATETGQQSVRFIMNAYSSGERVVLGALSSSQRKLK
ncbi:mitochondrial carrier domain-containing protein [Bombardia bombarda]|uniref:Mitochondrial carrier domain-containing protein n=1 Tax=Bombardia bombarda TaxID=252184 RepID=A0AA39WTT3_9PEZI|nr:mitochondrial carrier domain-containing protein [Bombardia bombarda]